MNKPLSPQTSHRKLRSFRDVTRNVGGQRQQKRLPLKNAKVSLIDNLKHRETQQLRENPDRPMLRDCGHLRIRKLRIV